MLRDDTTFLLGIIGFFASVSTTMYFETTVATADESSPLRAAIVGGHTHQECLPARLWHIREHVEVAVIIEDAGVEHSNSGWLLSAFAARVFFDKLR